MIKVYGIKNCNTVKKTIAWLDAHQISFEFHDFKKEGISKGKLENWSALAGWENLINRKGTTWRGLSEELKSSINNEESALNLMLEKTSVIKRPVIETDGRIIQGFNESELASLSNK